MNKIDIEKSSGHPSMFSDFRNENWQDLKCRVEAEPLPRSVYQHFENTASAYPDKEAWHFIDTETSRTWSQVLELVDRAAAALHLLGAREGDHVAIMATNIEEFPTLWLALARIGAAMVPVNARYSPIEVDYALTTSDAKFFLIEDELCSVLEKLVHKAIPNERLIIIGGKGPSGYTRWRSLVGAATGVISPVATPDPERVLNLQYTSGTTGFAKACMLPHSYWLICALTHHQIAATDLARMYANTSFYYMINQRMLVQAMFSGDCLVFPKTPTTSCFINHLVDYNLDYCTPLLGLMKQSERDKDRAHHVRISMSGLGDMSRGEQGAFHRRFHFPVQNIYGMTEYGVATYVPAHQIIELEDTGTIGFPAPFREVRIFDENGIPVASGEHGEICVRGTGMLKGYYGNKQATRDAFRGKYFRTGDIGWQDERGLFFLVGRSKDMVRRASENVPCVEVETALRLMPEIVEAAVIPVPDPVTEEEVKAYVQLKPGLTPENVPPEVIFAHCETRLAPFKMPRYLEYRLAFELTETFRVQKKKLKSESDDLISGSFDRKAKKWL